MPTRRCHLPPLILHPFSDAGAPERLALSTKASLILQGLLPPEETGEDELRLQYLQGRFCEIQMLYYLGKDVARWMDQCMEVVTRDEQLRDAGLQRESFAHLLVTEPPEAVRQKLHAWGVTDYRAIFRRALGLHAIFESVPEIGILAVDFMRYHQRYADALFSCRLELVPFTRIERLDFPFELYASGEYARLLERQWGSEEA